MAALQHHFPALDGGFSGHVGGTQARPFLHLAQRLGNRGPLCSLRDVEFKAGVGLHLRVDQGSVHNRSLARFHLAKDSGEPQYLPSESAGPAQEGAPWKWGSVWVAGLLLGEAGAVEGGMGVGRGTGLALASCPPAFPGQGASLTAIRD